MVLIDDRVGSKELHPHITAPKTLTRLSFGDVAFMGDGPNDTMATIAVERKTLPDLTSSIRSGRLSGHQLVGLLQSYQYVYLLIEGIWKRNPRTGMMQVPRGKGWRELRGKMSFQELVGFLNTLTVITGVIPWFTNNIKDSSAWVTKIYEWWQKPWEKHRAHTMFHRVRPPTMLVAPPFVQRVYKELEKVGWEKAQLLAANFPTVESLMNAEPKDIYSIKGFGKPMAERIYDELRSK